MPRRDLEELERWIEEHPVLARTYTIGLAILTVEIAMFIDQLMKRVAP